MNGRVKIRNRTKDDKENTITLFEAQKKTGLQTKSEIISYYRNEGILLRYNGKNKIFFY